MKGLFIRDLDVGKVAHLTYDAFMFDREFPCDKKGSLDK